MVIDLSNQVAYQVQFYTAGNPKYGIPASNAQFPNAQLIPLNPIAGSPTVANYQPEVT